MGRIIPYIMDNKSHVSNHQPVINMKFLPWVPGGWYVDPQDGPDMARYGQITTVPEQFLCKETLW